jgi:hypothetical protein
VGLAFLLSDAILIEKDYSQIAIDSRSNLCSLFYLLCKHHFKAHINKQGESCISAKQYNFNKKKSYLLKLTLPAAATSISCFLTCVKTTQGSYKQAR